MLVEALNEGNVTRIRSILHDVENNAVLKIPISGKPIIHHLLNTYFQSQNRKQKTDLVEIILLCIQKGADVDDDVQGEPSTVLKSLLIREIRITKALIDSSTASMVTSENLEEIYSIPCNPIPLAKLFLNADTFLNRKRKNNKDFNIKDVKSLLASAYLEGQKRTVQVGDLELFSESYDKLLNIIGSGEDFMLEDILSSLSELSNVAHQAIVSHSRTSPFDLIMALSHSTAPIGRNALHTLAMSGSVIMIKQLYHYFHDALSNEDDSLRAQLAAALTATDYRNRSAVDYATIRYGESPVLEAISQLLALSGHSPSSVSPAAAWKVAAVDPAAASSAVEVAAGGGYALQDFGGLRSAVDAQQQESGGWSTSRLPLDDGRDFGEDADRCDIKQVWNVSLPSADEFFRDYVATATPVVFRGAGLFSDPSLRTPSKLRRVFQKGRFLKKYGKEAVPTGAIPYASSFGLESGQATIAYVANQTDAPAEEGSVPNYVFTTAALKSASWQRNMQGDAPPPPCLSGLQDVVLQFYLGPAGSGAPVHFHGHAINSLAFGEKLWFLHPPSQAFYSKQSGLAFARSPRSRRSLRCTQSPGDLLYVPPLWGHGTLNLRQSIGVAHEFSYESFCME